MVKIYPLKLKKWDHIRVIAPSNSFKNISRDVRQIAIEKFKKYDFNITFSRNIEVIDEWKTSSIKQRLDDLHEAFEDSSVKCILTAIWGNSASQLLNHIDYNLIKKNPKILCGFSDITALSNAIFAKTGMVTYSGPHFSSWGMKLGFDYTEKYFRKCLLSNNSFEIKPSEEWRDDKWYLNQNITEFISNTWYHIVNMGNINLPIKWMIIGWNLTIINYLAWTPFLASFKNSILFLEHCSDEDSILTFDLWIQSLAHHTMFKEVKAIIIWRFQKKDNLSLEQLNYIFHTKKEYSDKLIIYWADFWHTTPFFTFPIWWEALIDIKSKSKVKIKIEKF